MFKQNKLQFHSSMQFAVWGCMVISIGLKSYLKVILFLQFPL